MVGRKGSQTSDNKLKDEESTKSFLNKPSLPDVSDSPSNLLCCNGSNSSTKADILKPGSPGKILMKKSPPINQLDLLNHHSNGLGDCKLEIETKTDEDKENMIEAETKDVIMDKDTIEEEEECKEIKLMQAEELRAEEQNKENDEQFKKALLAQRQEEKQLQEQRHKRLMHLLTKSQFYSQFLLEKINLQMEEENTSKSNTKVQEKALLSEENTGSSSDSNESSESSSKRKRKSKSVKGKAQSKKKQKMESQYEIGEVLDKKEVAKAAAGGQAASDSTSNVKQPQLLTGTQLRSYQLDGFNWLRVMYENGVSSLLADEMGLGKTVQTIALLCHLVEMGVKGPFLVVAPLSTLHNWCSEIRTFAPQLPYVLYHGPEPQRRSKLPLISQESPVVITSSQGETVTLSVLPIVVTSYEMAMASERALSGFRWRYLTVDEGHRLKNSKCRLIRCLKQYCSSNRLLLTGTPLQNSLAELWSLLNFLLPEVFDSLDVFESWFDVSAMAEEGAEQRILQQEQETQVISILHQILSPFLLRREKKDVALHLPPKRELLVYAHMTPLQLRLYVASLDRDLSVFGDLRGQEEEAPVQYDTKGRPVRGCTASPHSRGLQHLLEEDDSPAAFEKFLAALQARQVPSAAQHRTVKTPTREVRVKMQNRVMQCRRIVNHPYLVSYPLTPAGEYKVDEELVKSCGKLQVLDQLLGALHSRGHKVLLFSQMTKLLDILEDYLSLRPQYAYRRLDGSVRLEDRQADMEAFNTDEQIFLFLLSTRAASLGVNLTAADTVIIYDSDWNPQQDLQAQDRCHRLGQTRPVLVLRLVTAASVDEHIVQRASQKRCLEKIVIKARHFQSGPRTEAELMDREELLHLLEERDHHSVYKSDKTHGVFSKEELDRILDRSELQTSTNDDDNNNNKRTKNKKATASPTNASRGKPGKRNSELRDVFQVL